MIKIIAILLSFLVLVWVSFAIFKPNKKSNQARVEGFASGIHGEPYEPHLNPYPGGSKLHASFYKGWKDGYEMFSDYHNESLA